MAKKFQTIINDSVVDLLLKVQNGFSFSYLTIPTKKKLSQDTAFFY